MRIRTAIACLVLLVVSALRPAGGVAQGADAIDAPRISQQDFKKLIAANKVVIVDTRNADAFALSHIPGAVLLPLEGALTWPMDFEKKTVPMLLATKKAVVTYCA
jgi:rhodanese-related sulfurtransferase